MLSSEILPRQPQTPQPSPSVYRHQCLKAPSVGPVVFERSSVATVCEEKAVREDVHYFLHDIPSSSTPWSRKPSSTAPGRLPNLAINFNSPQPVCTAFRTDHHRASCQRCHRFRMNVCSGSRAAKLPSTLKLFLLSYFSAEHPRRCHLIIHVFSSL